MTKLLRCWILLLFLVVLLKHSTLGEEEYDYGEEDGSGSGAHDQFYEYEYTVEDKGESSGDYYPDYEGKHRYVDAELSYVPEMVSRSLELNIKARTSVTLPCEAKDADNFVRIWLKEEDMLFTGTIRLTGDIRFGLAEDNTSLVLENLGVEDSGVYECRIMVTNALSVKHSLNVKETLSLQTDPVDGVSVVPVHGTVEFGCQVLEQTGDSIISWSRDRSKFRDGSYTITGPRVRVENASLDDSGYYYCSVTDTNGEMRAASIHIQVQSAPTILEMRKSSLLPGTGLLLEISCTVTGHPKPKVLWYKDGETVANTDRLESQTAGTRTVLVINNFQDSDTGTYMCYALNSMGTDQKNIQVVLQDRDSTDILLDKLTSQEEKTGDILQLQKEINQLKNLYDQSEGVISSFHLHVEDQLRLIKLNQEVMNRTVVPTGVSTLDRSVFQDIELLDVDVRGLKTTSHQCRVDLDKLKYSSEDDRLRIWDSINELHEITNTTTRNIEDIYDKDIVRLHNIQNSIEGEVAKLKQDITGSLQIHSASSGEEPLSHDLQLSHSQLKEEVKSLRTLSKIHSNSQETVRADLLLVFSDIDSIKKELQDISKNFLQLKRLVNQIDREKVEENRSKIQGLSKHLSSMDSILERTSQRIRKLSKPKDDDKVNILVAEIQKIKNQVYVLQHTFLHRQTQDTLFSGNPEVDSAKTVLIPEEITQLKSKLEVLSSQVASLSKQDCVPKSHFTDEIEQIVKKQNDELDDWRRRFVRLEQENKDHSDKMNRFLFELNEVQHMMERREQEDRKHFLIFQGMLRRRKLEPPQNLLALVNSFIKEVLKLQDVRIEDAVRLTESNLKPHPIRVKFLRIRDRTQVITAARNLRTKVQVLEDFTERMKGHREKLVEFAKKMTHNASSGWALKQDRLFLQGKVFVFNESNGQVVPVIKN